MAGEIDAVDAAKCSLKTRKEKLSGRKFKKQW